MSALGEGTPFNLNQERCFYGSVEWSPGQRREQPRSWQWGGMESLDSWRTVFGVCVEGWGGTFSCLPLSDLSSA